MTFCPPPVVILLVSCQWRVFSMSSTTSCTIGAMADGFSKTVAFLATYCEELVQLQKPTLESLLKSNPASQVKEWNAAKNFWYPKVATLAAEQRELLEDWEFVLCDMSRSDVALAAVIIFYCKRLKPPSSLEPKPYRVCYAAER